MRYAQNSQTPGLLLDFLDWFDRSETDANTAKWVLVDGEILGRELIQTVVKTFGKSHVRNVFSESDFSVYGWRAPHLIRIASDKNIKNCLIRLIRVAGDFPAVARLEGCGDYRNIRRLLLWLAHARTTDGGDLYCRFADTRITPCLLQILARDQKEILQKYIANWQIIGREGTIETVFSRSEALRAELDPLELPDSIDISDFQFSKMMEFSEGDEIFLMLCAASPELVPACNLGSFHLLLAGLTHAARARGIELTSEIYQFCVIALTTRHDFFMNTILAESWREIRARSRSFTELASLWTDETWDALMHEPLTDSTLVSETRATS
ncbi:DUF4123 domain-containing protein [Massilia sp. TWR1-2-2]|uniref:DUF4123 domain-containing protein n=1 Tax=Massilia sp. TWR1-2-2 TaxID=2804584 RepID=UPI003CF0EB8F